MKKLVFIFLMLVFLGCESDECGSCGGGVLDGYLFKTVTEDDRVQLSSTLPELELEACIRFKFELNGSDFNLETVTVVDDCCCDLY